MSVSLSLSLFFSKVHPILVLVQIDFFQGAFYGQCEILFHSILSHLILFLTGFHLYAFVFLRSRQNIGLFSLPEVYKSSGGVTGRFFFFFGGSLVLVIDDDDDAMMMR